MDAQVGKIFIRVCLGIIWGRGEVLVGGKKRERKKEKKDHVKSQSMDLVARGKTRLVLYSLSPH